MTFKKLEHTIMFPLVFIFCLWMLVMPKSVSGQASYSITILNESHPVSGLTYKLWKLDQAEELDLTAFQDWSLANLDQHFVNQVISSPSDSKGQSQVTGLEEGVYYVRALTATGQSHQTVVPFFVSLPRQANHTISVKTQLETGGLVITKVSDQLDSSGRSQRLAGVVFQIYEANNPNPLKFVDGVFNPGQGSANLLTDSAGQIHLSNLSPGAYVIKEVASLPGYQALNLPIEVTIESRSIVQVQVQNKVSPTGGYKFRKVSADNPNLGLPGAEFKVVTWDGQAFQDVVTDQGSPLLVVSDQQGKFEVNNLAYGIYYLIETRSPVYQGLTYKRLEEAIEFNITPSSYLESTLLAIKNQPNKPGVPGEIPPLPKTPPGISGGGNLPSTGEHDQIFVLSLAWLLIILSATIGLRHFRSKLDDY